MDIAIIGAGNIGSTLGAHLLRAGHHVMFAARDDAKLRRLVDGFARNAFHGSPEEAVGFAGVVIVAAPYGAWPVLGRTLGGLLTGKIVVDAANPYPARDGSMAADAVQGGRGSGESTAAWVAGARVVKAFNTLYWKDLAARANAGVGVPLAGDDADAVSVVSMLIRDIGFEPVVAGGLADSRRFDPGRPAYGQPMSPQELKAALLAVD